MARELILTKARIVGPENVVTGTVLVREGRIEAVEPGESPHRDGVDFEGDLLLPGLIELHTDGLERHMMPRPGVLWPSALTAVLAHDLQIIGAGITTVLDAVAVGDYIGDQNEVTLRNQMLHGIVGSLRKGKQAGLFKADHLLHLRCEISDEQLIELFEPYASDPDLRMISVMDHTPGQRQWADLAQFRKYYQDRKWSEEKIRTILEAKQLSRRNHAKENRARIIEMARRSGLPLASHDDTTEHHVAQAAGEGFSISEFPTTLAAAQKAKRLGLKTVMGAPNVVRGHSHSGNVSAQDLAALGLLDVLSSDYVPHSLLHSAFILHQAIGLSLPEAVATVTSTPADLVNLTDRGKILPGLRADLVRVALVDGLPVTRSVWRQGLKMV